MDGSKVGSQLVDIDVMHRGKTNLDCFGWYHQLCDEIPEEVFEKSVRTPWFYQAGCN